MPERLQPCADLQGSVKTDQPFPPPHPFPRPSGRPGSLGEGSVRGATHLRSAIALDSGACLSEGSDHSGPERVERAGLLAGRRRGAAGESGQLCHGAAGGGGGGEEAERSEQTKDGASVATAAEYCNEPPSPYTRRRGDFIIARKSGLPAPWTCPDAAGRPPGLAYGPATWPPGI